MSELTMGGLSLLQQVGAGGLVASIVLAGVCAFVLLAAGNEQDRRQALVTQQAIQSARAEAANEGVPDQVRLRTEAQSARAELVALREVAARASEEAERLSRVNASLAQRLSVEAPEAERPAEGEGLPSRLLAPEVLAALQPENARTLAQTQANALADDLKGHAGDFSVEVTSAPDEEARLYAAQLAAAFRQAGIPTEGPYGVLTTLKGEGVFVSTEGPRGDAPGATVLSALQNASLPAQPAPNDADAATFLLPEGTDVRVYVGGAPGA